MGPCIEQDSIKISKIICPASQGEIEGESQAGISTISPVMVFHEEKTTRRKVWPVKRMCSALRLDIPDYLPLEKSQAIKQKP